MTGDRRVVSRLRGGAAEVFAEAVDVLVAGARVHEDGIFAGDCAEAALGVVVRVRDELDPVGVEADFAAAQEEVAVVVIVARDAFAIVDGVLNRVFVGKLGVGIADRLGIVEAEADAA